MKMYLKIIALSSLFVIIQAIVSMNTTLLNTSCNNADDSIFLEQFGKYFIYLTLLNIVLFKMFDLLRINKNIIFLSLTLTTIACSFLVNYEIFIVRVSCWSTLDEKDLWQIPLFQSFIPNIILGILYYKYLNKSTSR